MTTTISEKMSRPSTPKKARLETRISQELRDTVEHLAKLTSRDITQFVTDALAKEIKAVQESQLQSEIVRLSLRDQERFAQALLSPPPMAPALVRAFERRKKLLASA